MKASSTYILQVLYHQFYLERFLRSGCRMSMTLKQRILSIMIYSYPVNRGKISFQQFSVYLSYSYNEFFSDWIPLFKYFVSQIIYATDSPSIIYI